MKSDRTAKTDESKALDSCFFQTIYQTHQRHAKCVTKTKEKESKPSTSYCMLTTESKTIPNEQNEIEFA